MIDPAKFFEALRTRGITLFSGVPDSLLKNMCAYIDDYCLCGEHIITANEGNAIALVTGYYLATGKLGAVYMQNSGLGNAINPLTSLTDPEVYRVPMLLIIGWRGEPGVKDEPQHIKQGRITPKQLSLLEIPFWILDAQSDLETMLSRAFLTMNNTNAPVALLVRNGTFLDYKSQRKNTQGKVFYREDALKIILSLMQSTDIVIATTGKTSREVFDLRATRGESQRDFLTVGSMGHASSIALGTALGKPQRRVICLDGDGALLMHLGAMPIIGCLKPQNFIHVLLNNAAHESVGGQRTAADRIDFAALSRACGYNHYYKATDADSLSQCWQLLAHQPGPVLLEITICQGSRGDLGRPAQTPAQIKRGFMENIHD